MKVNRLITQSFLTFSIALICAIMWGSSFPIVKCSFFILDIQNNISGKLYFACYRFLIAGLALFLIVFMSGKSIFIFRKKDYLYLTIIGFAQTTALYAFFYIGLSNTTGVKASIITASGSFFLAIFSHFLFKSDPLTFKKSIGLLIGFIGILFINFKELSHVLDLDFKFVGEGFILIGAIFSAFGNILAKFIVKRVSPLLICAYQFTIGSVLLFFISLLIGSPINFIFSIKSVFLLVILSIISATAFSLWYFLIKNNPLSSIAIYRFLIPICGTFFSVFFIKGENLNLLIFISVLLVCTGMILTSDGK